MNEPLLLKIGKALDNNVILNIPFISDYHLELFQDIEGNVFMTDLNSLNGTFVNGRKLTGFIMLNPKDEVFLGSGYKFQWENILQDSTSSIKETAQNKVLPKKEPRTFTDAHEKNRKVVEVKKEKVESPKNENRNLIIIYGLILLFVVYWMINF